MFDKPSLVMTKIDCRIVVGSDSQGGEQNLTHTKPTRLPTDCFPLPFRSRVRSFAPFSSGSIEPFSTWVGHLLYSVHVPYVLCAVANSYGTHRLKVYLLYAK